MEFANKVAVGLSVSLALFIFQMAGYDGSAAVQYLDFWKKLQGAMLAVGISYDREKKEHSCKIEVLS